VRQESARTVGRGTSVLDSVMGLRELPKMLTRPPGATGLVKSAELTRRSSTGGAVAASNTKGRTVNPEVVRAMIAERSARGATVRRNGNSVSPNVGASTIMVGRAVGAVAGRRRT